MSATLNFVSSPLGFSPLVDFTLDDVEGANGLYTLQAAGGGIRLFVLDAGVYLPDYSPEITDEQGDGLDLARGEDAMVLVVANPDAGGTTVNLLAPIIVNTTTGRCAQMILEGQDWPIRAELASV